MNGNITDDKLGSNTESKLKFPINIPGQTIEEVIHKYNNWKTYDSDLNDQGYNGPSQVADAVKAYYPIEKRGNVKILDVGAGTGLVSKKLRDEGFTYIDGLDASQGMLDQAREQGLYNNYFVEYLTSKPIDGISDDTYDILTGCGCLGENHIPVEALHEVVRIVKPGGLVFIICKAVDKTLYQSVDELIEQMEIEDKLVLVEKSVRNQYRKGYATDIFIYKVL